MSNKAARKAEQAVILDTSVWIAFLHVQDNQHKKAQKLLESVTAPIVVPEYILLEVTTVLRLKKRYKEAAQFAAMVMDTPGVFLPAMDISEKVVRFFIKTPKSSLSFVDASLLILSHEYQVITFDQALKRAISKESKENKK